MANAVGLYLTISWEELGTLLKEQKVIEKFERGWFGEEGLSLLHLYGNKGDDVLEQTVIHDTTKQCICDQFASHQEKG